MPSPGSRALLLVLVAKIFATQTFAQVEPAATAVPVTSPAGVDLFADEALQLTDAAVDRISNDQATTGYAKLFAFDDNSTAQRNSSCRVFPGDENYPSSAIWSVFDQLLGGALIKTVPVAAPCYKSSGVYNEAECADISARFITADLHTSDPTSMMWPIFQGRTCLPTTNPNGTCTLGGYPNYVVNVTNVAQIQLAVNFARNSNLRLVVKNTGHDYIGKSSGAGALSVWTHHLKDIEFLSNYTSETYTGNAFKVGAGVQGFEILQAAHEQGLSVLAGICQSVGFAGGYLAGGGHSPLASIYGMAADQILGFEVVTASGRFVTATPSLNSDLFYALSGGGGGTYGIVTSVIVRAHPKIPVTRSTFNFQASTVGEEAFWAGLRAYFELFPTFTAEGTYGYFWIWNIGGDLDFQMTPFFAPNHTVERFEKLVEPLFRRFEELNMTITPNTTYYDDYLPAYQGAFGEDYLGITSLRQGTRLFPASIWDDEDQFSSFFETVKNTVTTGHTVGGYHMHPQNPLNANNAVNPAWRSTMSFLITGTNVPDNATPAQLEATSNDLTFNVTQPWRDVAPNDQGGGVYLNEADIQEPNWQEDFYGKENYQKLLAIKAKWDPRDLFYATTGVGSERWVVEDGDQGVQTQNGRLCRV